MLAAAYHKGDGVLQDKVAAWKWYALALQNGAEPDLVQEGRRALERLMTPDEVELAKRMVKEFAAKIEKDVKAGPLKTADQ
jgi:TPR repeat protein